MPHQHTKEETPLSPSAAAAASLSSSYHMHLEALRQSYQSFEDLIRAIDEQPAQFWTNEEMLACANIHVVASLLRITDAAEDLEVYFQD